MDWSGRLAGRDAKVVSVVAAKALGAQYPAHFLALADEVLKLLAACVGNISEVQLSAACVGNISEVPSRPNDAPIAKTALDAEAIAPQLPGTWRSINALYPGRKQEA